VRYRAEACLEGLEGWGCKANRKHWAKSGIVAFDDKDSANRFYSAAVAKHHRSCITTWQLGLLYIVCLIPRYAEALERSKPLVCVRANCKREPLPGRKHCDTCSHITQQNHVRPVRTFD